MSNHLGYRKAIGVKDARGSSAKVCVGFTPRQMRLINKLAEENKTSFAWAVRYCVDKVLGEE